VKLSEFKRLVAAFPDHEDAEVWIEAPAGLLNPVAAVRHQLGAHDVILSSTSVEDGYAAPRAFGVPVPAQSFRGFPPGFNPNLCGGQRKLCEHGLPPVECGSCG
jgi:hypothetical protein